MNSRSMLLGGGVVGWLTISSMAAASLRAAASSNEVDGAVFLPPASTVRDARGNEARVLREGAVWRRFTMRYGAWQAWWNASTGTPHRALGPPIPLAGYADDAASVDRAVRRFVTREGALFGAPDLETILSRRDGNVWLVRYRRHIQGVPVLFEDWEFWVNHRGGLMAFGFDAHRPTTGLATRPVLPWAVAREAAHAGVPYDPGSDRVEGGALVLVPVAGETGGFRLAYRAQVETMSPRARWNTLVDGVAPKIVPTTSRPRTSNPGTSADNPDR